MRQFSKGNSAFAVASTVSLLIVSTVTAAPECWRCCFEPTNWGWHDYNPDTISCIKSVPASALFGYAPPDWCKAVAHVSHVEEIQGETHNRSVCPQNSCSLYCDGSEDCNADPNNVGRSNQFASASGMDCADPEEYQLYQCVPHSGSICYVED